jgi:hypothetical protein
MSHYTYSTPFEQFAQDASGTTVSLRGTSPQATHPVAHPVAPHGLGMFDDALGDYGKLVVGAAGMGAMLGYVLDKRKGRYGAPVMGALVHGGATAALAGIFGGGLTTSSRLGLGAAGAALLAGAWYTSRS